jgi:hypothetical protein
MLEGHFESAGASIEYGDAGVLFPVEELDAAVLQRRDAELALADADGENVIVITPTNLASSYFLTQHTLTAIPIEELTPAVRIKLADTLDAPIATFELIQVGKWVTDSLDHSLAEYTDARGGSRQWISDQDRDTSTL